MPTKEKKMNYEKYTNTALEWMADGRLPKEYRLLSEEELEQWLTPIAPDPKIDRELEILHCIVYKKLKRLTSGTVQEQEVDKIYKEFYESKTPKTH